MLHLIILFLSDPPQSLCETDIFSEPINRSMRSHNITCLIHRSLYERPLASDRTGAVWLPGPSTNQMLFIHFQGRTLTQTHKRRKLGKIDFHRQPTRVRFSSRLWAVDENLTWNASSELKSQRSIQPSRTRANAVLRPERFPVYICLRRSTIQFSALNHVKFIL